MKTPTLKYAAQVLATLAFSATALAQVPPAPTAPRDPPSTTSPATPPAAPPSGGLITGPAPSFESLDANSDGRLSATEAQADVSLATKFSALDRQTKGYLTKPEFQSFIQSKQPGTDKPGITNPGTPNPR